MDWVGLNRVQLFMINLCSSSYCIGILNLLSSLNRNYILPVLPPLQSIFLKGCRPPSLLIDIDEVTNHHYSSCSPRTSSSPPHFSSCSCWLCFVSLLLFRLLCFHVAYGVLSFCRMVELPPSQIAPLPSPPTPLSRLLLFLPHCHYTHPSESSSTCSARPCPPIVHTPFFIKFPSSLLA